LEFNFFNFFFYIRLGGIRKEAFVANAIRIVLEHPQLLIHHATKVVKVATKYCTNMGIVSSSSSLKE
jgi:hypothetical protein